MSTTDIDTLKLPARQEFGASQSLELRNETAATSIAAQAKAMVESRYVMAMRAPRDWDQVRSDLLKECRRPSFAHNKSAYYHKPIGKGVEGLGIRFVEVALRCMRNVLIETKMIFEDETKEIHNVAVTDLESNITYPMDVKVSKTVERSKPADDGSYLAMRLNSYNKPVFTVPANDDDLLNKRAALISKAIRTLGLRVIPGDLQDEAEDIIKQIRTDQAAKDPDAERRRIVDAFAELNISATQLKEYLSHDLAQCTPAQLVNLRGLYGALRDGEATWQTVMEEKAAEQAKSQSTTVESLRSGRRDEGQPADKIDKETGEIRGGGKAEFDPPPPAQERAEQSREQRSSRRQRTDINPE